MAPYRWFVLAADTANSRGSRLVALENALMLKAPMDSGDLVRMAAFKLLASRGEPIALATLAEVTGIKPERMAFAVDELDAAGRIRRNAAGQVVGSGGLSVVPDRHQIDIEGRRFWTWCAYDILGIFGGLRANGRAVSPSPSADQPIEMAFVSGRPQREDVVLFRPAAELMDGCENVYADWCPNSNLFATRELAESWAQEHKIDGSVLGMGTASSLATADWESFADGLVLWREPQQGS